MKYEEHAGRRRSKAGAWSLSRSRRLAPVARALRNDATVSNTDALCWISPEVASACYEIKLLAPSLADLICVADLPDPSLAIVLDWAEVANISGSMAAFDLDRLQDVLLAMVVAFLASYTCRLERTGGSAGAYERIVLYDNGHGAIISWTMMLVTEIAVPAHGLRGLELGHISRSDLARRLSAASGWP